MSKFKLGNFYRIKDTHGTEECKKALKHIGFLEDDIANVFASR